METKIYNMSGEETGIVTLPESIFGLPKNIDLVHQIRISMLANTRHPIAHSKDRSEVRGGGKKPWRQKGTGRARHGSRRSPIWKGGGVSHGPRNTKNYSKKINSAMAQLALKTVLSSKFKDNQIAVVKDFSLDAPKTKDLKSLVKKFTGASNFGSMLIVLPSNDKNVSRSSRNLSNIKVDTVSNLNVLDILKFKKIVFTESAIKKIRSTKSEILNKSQ